MPTFFINGTSLSNSTAVFLDSEQLICAPDGYYSDGVITREQVGCALLPQNSCPSCEVNCPASDLAVSASPRAVFYMSINVGTGTGVVLVRFNPRYEPDGIIAEYNGFYYNQLSSPVYGYFAAPSNLPVFVGNSGFCSCPTIGTSGCTYSLAKREWNGTTFVTVPGIETINVVSTQVSNAAGPVGFCVMVIPKTIPSVTTVNIRAYITCPGSLFDISVGCVQPLQTFQASDRVFSPLQPGYCGLSPFTNTFYVAKVALNPPFPYIAENDWVFQDMNGEVKLADGYYRTNNIVSTPLFPKDTIYVQNGVVVAITQECP
jgi:hypothetical protein